MRGELPEIRGSKREIYEGYNALQSLSKECQLDNIYHSRISGQNALSKSDLQEDPRYLKIAWHLRYHKDGISLMHELKRLEKRIFREIEDDREIFLFTFLINSLSYDFTLLQIYKSFKIDDDHDQMLSQLYDLGEVVRQLIRHLHPIQMKLTIASLHNIFERIKSLRGKYLML